MNVLSLDTSGPVVGVALSNRYRSVSWEHRITRNADVFLAERTQSLIARERSWFPQPDVIMVSIGPGAFTSLRVGVAFALGLAFSYQVPVLPVSSLEVRSMLVSSPRTLVLMDAKKNRFYAQCFDRSGEQPVALSPAQDIPAEAVLDMIDATFPFIADPGHDNPRFVAVGEGAIKLESELNEVGGLVLLDGCRSPALAACQLASLRREAHQDPAHIRLNYIRPPDAVPPKNLGIPLGRPIQN